VSFVNFVVKKLLLFKNFQT